MFVWDLAQIINISVCLLVMLISLGIGLYFSLQQKSLSEYAHGGHKMGLLPVSVSLVVSWVSAITMQGVPAEVYLFGLDIIFMVVGLVIGILLVNITFLPIFYSLKLESIYQYLEIRYQSQVPKIIGCISDILLNTTYTGILFYGTAVAIESLLGIPAIYNLFTMAVVCTVYTTLGGLRGVIWTDLFQAGVMILGLVAVIAIGANSMTGGTSIWDEMRERGRTTLNFNLSILQRNSVWIYMVFFIFRTTSGFCSQMIMIRFTALPSIAQAKISLGIASVFFAILQILGITLGIVVFAYYSQLGCGPLSARQISTPNQIIPYFVKQVVKIPGFVGIFVAAAISGTMSTASSTQNAIASIVLQDLVTPIFPDLSDRKKTVILKGLVSAVGVVILVVAFMSMFIEGTVFQVSNAADGVLRGPAFGMFLLGACFTHTSAPAAVIGYFISTAFVFWLAAGNLFVGTLWNRPTLISDNCHDVLNSNSSVLWRINSTIADTMLYGNDNQGIGVNTTASSLTENLMTGNAEKSYFIALYSMSPYSYHFFGIGITFLIGALLSLIPKFRHRQEVDAELVFPFLRKWLIGNGDSGRENEMEKRNGKKKAQL